MVKHRRFIDAVFHHIRKNGARPINGMQVDIQIKTQRGKKRRFRNPPTKQQIARLMTADPRFLQIKDKGSNVCLWGINEEYLQKVKKDGEEA